MDHDRRWAVRRDEWPLALLWQGGRRLGRQRRFHCHQSDNWGINHRLTTRTAAGWWARASSGLSRPIGRRRWSIIFWGSTTGHLLPALGSNASLEILSL